MRTAPPQGRTCPLQSQVALRKEGVPASGEALELSIGATDLPKARERSAEEVRQHRVRGAERSARFDEQERLYLVELPCFRHPTEADESSSARPPADYAAGLRDIADSPIWNEAALVILNVWPWPLHIDFSLVDVDASDLSPLWQILGPDALMVEPIMEAWARVSKTLDRQDEHLLRSIGEVMPPTPNAILRGLADAFKARPGPFAINPRHRRLHELAERDGGWTCHYCARGLVDVCSDQDMTMDTQGGRFLRPGLPKRFPTVDHLVPQSLGGSNGLPNLVLACQPCNSAKGAR